MSLDHAPPRSARRPGMPSRVVLGPTGGWIWQTLSGVLLLGLLGFHIVVEHFLPGGLRGFAAVISLLANPALLAVEAAFLLTLTWHALLGVRSILFDLGPSPRAGRWIGRGLTAIGTVTVGYGLWLLLYLTAHW